MKYILTAILVLLFVAVIMSAQAQTTTVPQPPQMDLTFTWSPPTARNDGTPMRAAEIAEYEFGFKLKTATDWKTVMLPGTAVTHKITNLPSGQYEARIAVRDTFGLWSTYVSLQTVSVPGAVSNFKVSATKSLPLPGTVP